MRAGDAHGVGAAPRAAPGRRWLGAGPERHALALVGGVLGALVVRAFLLARGAGAAGSAAAVAAGLAAAVLLARRLPAALDGAARRHRALAVILALLAVVAVVQTERLGAFMAVTPSPARVHYFNHGWRHNCLTAYVAAARLDRTHDANVYDVAHYKFRHVEGIQLDPFLYPPPFLLLPRLGIALTDDLLTLRAGWFVLESALVWLALLVVAAWVGRRQGLVVGLCGLALWIAPPTLQTLLYGNFHLAALALSALAMVAFARRRRAVGGLLLGFAVVSKVFPGLLLLWLLAQRRFRDVLFTVGAIAAYSLATLALSGPVPFRAFFAYMLPLLLSGDAFFFLDLPRVATVSHSVSGLLLKARLLGATVPSSWVTGLSWLYSAVLVAIVVRFARRPVSRLHEAQLWVALLHLGALRSAFLPQEYALTAPLWLLVLLAPEVALRRGRWWPLGAAFLACAVVFPVGSGGRPFPDWVVVTGVGVGQVVGMGLALWAVLRVPPAAGVEAPAATAPAIPGATLTAAGADAAGRSAAPPPADPTPRRKGRRRRARR